MRHSLGGTAEIIRGRPTPPAHRIVALDLLRGFALLGILVMNIQAFSMPMAAYFNPTAYGDLAGLNRSVWFLSHLLTDQKFMTIFSLLFGAGILLLAGRLEARGQPAWRTHYRRNFWLLLFGLAHAYLLWWGDVLVLYALCGFVVFWFRKFSPRWLLLLALLSLAVPSILVWFGGATMPYWPPEVLAEMRANWQPALPAIQAELAGYRGGWLAQMEARIPQSLEIDTVEFLFWGFWRAGGLMLLGMALYKWQVLTARRSSRFYAAMLLIGLPVGVSLAGYGAYQNFARQWEMVYSRFGLGFQFNYWGSLLASSGYVGLVMLWAQWGGLPRLQTALAAVGRTALSNYFLQTLIATTIFYGHGFGLFGAVERTGQILFVLAIWIFQLVWSPIWLHYFRFGPAEWLWRSLTYRQLQPMRAPTTE
jgi:uncharacterized protein